jgi:thiol-disulfide isomerase/thioredoxin
MSVTRPLARGITRRSARAAALAAALALVLVPAGCGGDDGTFGGADDLPGPVPEGVTFAKAPANAIEAHDFTATLTDGTPVQGSELWKDRPVVLVFTASWCEACADVHRAAAQAVDEQQGAVALLGLAPPDDAEGARDYAKDLDVGWPLGVADDKVWLDYAAREPPVVVLVGPGGKVLRGWPGGVDEAVLARELDALVER